jgi:hypothetical protein
MSKYQKHYAAWVAEDGSYGAGEVVLFAISELTDLEWEIIADETADTDRLDVVKQLLDNKKENADV